MKIDGLDALQAAIAEELARAEAEAAAVLRALGVSQAVVMRRDVDALTAALAAVLERVMALGDLSGRVEVLTGRPAPKPADVAPRGEEPPTLAPQRVVSRVLRQQEAAAPPAPGALTRYSPPRTVWTPEDVREAVEESGPQGIEVLGDVPAVIFGEAVRDLATRDPVGAEALRRAGLEVAAVYAPMRVGARLVYPHGFAAAEAATRDVARRVQARLVAGMQEGTPTEDVARAVAEDTDMPSALARTVVRTNYVTATTAGRFVEAERVHAGGIATGFVIDCSLDSNLRSGRPQDNGENHAAMDGFAARVDDPVWLTHSPPYGFNCRCLARVVVGPEVPVEWRKAPAAARFAPGFGGRPRSTYG